MVRILDDEISRRVLHPREHRLVQRIAADDLGRDTDTAIAQRLREFLDQRLQIIVKKGIAPSGQIAFGARLPQVSCVADQKFDVGAEPPGEQRGLCNCRLLPYQRIRDDQNIGNSIHDCPHQVPLVSRQRPRRCA